MKEIGKFIQNIRTLGSDLTTTFENNMNDVVQLEELRKAQRELNDAFSFRRSINVEPESEAFSVQPAYNSATSATWDSNGYESGNTGSGAAVTAMASTATASSAVTATSTTNPPIGRKVRRRILKKAPVSPPPSSPSFPTVTDYGMPNFGDVPAELDMSSYYNNNEVDKSSSSSSSTMSAEELDEIEREFDQYTSTSTNTASKSSNTMDMEETSTSPWFNTENDTETKPLMTSSTGTTTPKETIVPLELQQQQQSRFQQQLSGTWNNQVIANEDKLEPIAVVMNQIALLEKQKKEAMERITEEYEQKKKLETSFYLQQRQLLEQAVTNVQNEAFGITSTTTATKKDTTTSL